MDSREKFINELQSWIREHGQMEARQIFYGFMQSQEDAGKFLEDDGLSRGECLEAWNQAVIRAAN